MLQMAMALCVLCSNARHLEKNEEHTVATVALQKLRETKLKTLRILLLYSRSDEHIYVTQCEREQGICTAVLMHI